MTIMTPGNVTEFAGLTIRRGTRDATQGLFFSIYGTGGGGKTTIASEIIYSEHGNPALLCDVDASSDSVLHLVDKGLTIIQPTSWNEVLRVTKEFERGNSVYKALIWDNVSEIQQLCIKRHAPSGMPEGSAALKIWGQVHAEMMDWVRTNRMIALRGTNVLFVLWEETEKDDLTGRIRFKVALTPKFAAAYPGMVTMVGRLTVPGDARNGYIRKLSFAPSETTDAKFRIAPTDEAASIPLEVWLRKDKHFLADFIATVRDGKPFPKSEYAAPPKQA